MRLAVVRALRVRTLHRHFSEPRLARNPDFPWISCRTGPVKQALLVKRSGISYIRGRSFKEVRVAQSWTPQSWQNKPIRQVPEYPDKAALDAVLGRLKTHPPLV